MITTHSTIHEAGLPISLVILLPPSLMSTMQQKIPDWQWLGEVLMVVCEEPISDFAKIRNQAMGQAHHNWILMLDSDEEIPSALKRELEQLFISENVSPYYAAPTTTAAYVVHRLDIFHRQTLHWGEPGTTNLIRLINRTKCSYHGSVHEEVITHGAVMRLESPIHHYAHSDLSQFVDSIRQYSFISSNQSSSQKTSRIKLIFWPPFKVLYNLFVKLGILDGVPGIAYAWMMGIHSLAAKVTAYEKKHTP